MQATPVVALPLNGPRTLSPGSEAQPVIGRSNSKTPEVGGGPRWGDVGDSSSLSGKSRAAGPEKIPQTVKAQAVLAPL
jgi:hypothetical protein